MGIYQSVNLGFTVFGDGTSVEQLLDLSKWIETPISAGSPFNAYPTKDIVVLVQPVFAYSVETSNNVWQAYSITGTAEVIGKVVRIIWNSAPPTLSATVVGNGASITIGY